MTNEKTKGETIPEELAVSIVMPCLDEEEGVERCIADAQSYLSRANLSGEVIVVDNGSTDRSAELAAGAGARVIAESHRGYGAALLRGFTEAHGRILVMGDCDGTYPFADLEPFIDPIQAGDVDLVIGNRLTSKLDAAAMPWAHRHIGTPAISLIIRIFTGLRIRDSQCGLRALSREAFDRMSLQAPGMEFASEMLMEAARAKLRIKEVPIEYHVRVGDAKLRTFRDGWRHFRYLLKSRLGRPTDRASAA